MSIVVSELWRSAPGEEQFASIQVSKPENLKAVKRNHLILFLPQMASRNSSNFPPHYTGHQEG